MTFPILPWLALLWGLVYLMSQSFILASVRMALTQVWSRWTLGPWLTVLLYCPACCGFWMALLLHQFAPWPAQEMLWAPLEAMIISCGVMTLIDRQWPSNIFEIEQGAMPNDTPMEIQDESALN